jgi:hypothetical protein
VFTNRYRGKALAKAIIISVLRRLRQEDRKFKAILDYIARPCYNTNTQTKNCKALVRATAEEQMV